jgi:hypothetical protein
MFPRIGSLQLAQATTEVIGHLDVLYGAGEALRDRSGARVRYRLASGVVPVRRRDTV